MIKRIGIGVLAVVIAAVLAFALWWFRPWSPYSPAQITALDDPDAYPVTFQRMDEILPSTPIEPGDPEPLPRAEASLPQTYVFDGETRDLESYFERAEVTGVTVLRDGVIVEQAFFHGAGPDTRFTSWSVAKSVVASLVAMALEEGRIESLEDPAEKYAPQFAGTDYGATSLRHLLMMSAGMDFNEEYSPDAPSDVRPLFFNAFIMGRDVDAMVGEIERDRTPGEDQHYTSPNSHVLAAVVRGIYGERLAEIVEAKIWTPLGMTGEASWLQNVAGEDGIAIGYCCLQATSADYARLGEFWRVGGVWEGERMLPEGFIPSWTAPSRPFQEPGATPYPGRGYAMHFWVPEGYDGEFYAAGVYGQYVWVDTRRGVVIAQNAGDENWGEIALEAAAVFRAIAEHISPLDARPEAELDALREAVRARPITAPEEDGAPEPPSESDPEAGSEAPGR
ncbi:MAG: serine hydrolase [Oceanicaulis sp.]